MESYLLDTNVIIRFLRQDHPTMGPAARGLFQAAARGEVRLLLEESIVAEAVYVLQSVYKQSRTDVADALQALVRRAPAIQTDRPEVLDDALERFRRQPGWTLPTPSWPPWRLQKGSRSPHSTVTSSVLSM